MEDDKLLNNLAYDLKGLKEKYRELINSGRLDKDLQKLAKMQKRALTTNGPHPHYSQASGGGGAGLNSNSNLV